MKVNSALSIHTHTSAVYKDDLIINVQLSVQTRVFKGGKVHRIAVFETFFKEYIGQIVAKATSTFCVTTAPLRQ